MPKMLKKTFVSTLIIAAMLSPLTANARTCNVVAGEYRQKQAGYKKIYSKCGDELISDGWAKTADCNDGHQWFYVLRIAKYDKTMNKNNGGYKDSKPPMFCQGINALAGPEEVPCVPLNNDNKKLIDNCYKYQTR